MPGDKLRGGSRIEVIKSWRHKMKTETMEIVNLEPMHVAAVWAFGPNPEELAWQKLTAWAAPLGLLTAEHRIFGFNDPSPSAGSPNYGYQFWITVSPEVEPAEGIRMIDAPGGRYAVHYADVAGNYAETIPAAWQRLDSWVAANAYDHGSHQWLEEHSAEGVPFAFYYPIAE
jgi:DNA gyrase inhibitor GyrI